MKPFAFGLRAVALFDCAKGMLVLYAGFGIAHLVHRDMQEVADELVERLHLDPARHYPHIFLDLVSNITDAELWGLAMLAATYAGIRFAEAYGLWFGRRWAEWLAALSGGIYVPLEIYSLTRGVTGIKLGALILNLAIVIYMARVLWRTRPSSPAG